MTYKDCLAAFANKHILVVGDVMVDRYFEGSIDRISPEAPVPIFKLSDKVDRLGGAANVALNIRQYGAKVSLAGVCGDDNETAFLTEHLELMGIGQDLLFEEAGRPTTVKTRLMARNQQVIRVDRETTVLISSKTEAMLCEAVVNKIDQSEMDCIVLQDYNKGVLTPRLIKEVMAAAKSKGVPVVVDPKKNNIELFEGAFLFKPNQVEVFELTGQYPNAKNKETLMEIASTIQQKLQVDFVMITLSDEGMYLYGKNHSLHIPAIQREVADVCGAGDSVIAAIALCVTVPDMGPKHWAALANRAGGIVCEQVGVAPVNVAQLQEELGAQEL